jgi:hypothetical protein
MWPLSETFRVEKSELQNLCHGLSLFKFKFRSASQAAKPSQTYSRRNKVSMCILCTVHK